MEAPHDIAVGHTLLSALPARLYAFVLDTSLLDTLTATTADALRDTQDAAEALAALANQGLPIPYPADLRTAAQATLARTDHARFVALTHRLAVAAEAAGDLLGAAARYLQLDALGQIAALTERHGQSLYEAGHLATLHDLLALVPEGEQTPAIFTLRVNLALQRGAWREALDLAERTLCLAAPAELTAIIRIQRARALLFLNQVDVALSECEAVLAEPQPAGVRARALRTLSHLVRTQNDRVQAVAYLQEALAAARTADERHLCTLILNDLGNEYSLGGERGLAIAHMREADAILSQLGNLPERTLTLNNLGVLYHEQGDHQLAVATLTQAATLARSIGNERYLGLASFSLGDVFSDEQRWEEAQLAYELAQRMLAHSSPMVRRALPIAIAHLERRRGRIAAAAAILDALENQDEPGALLARGVVCALSDELTTAMACLAGATPGLSLEQRWRELALAQLFSAFVAHAQGAPTAAVAAALRAAVQITRQRFGHDLMLRADLPPLLPALRAASAEPAAAAWLELLGERPRATPTPEQPTMPRVPEEPPPPQAGGAWQISSAAAHDLLNLLMVISGNAELLQIDTVEAAQREHLRVILNAVDDASRLVRRLQHGGLLSTPTSGQPIRLRTLAASAVAYLRSGGWVGPGTTIVQNIPEECLVDGTLEDLRRLVFNLAKNALEAMGSGGVLTLQGELVLDEGGAQWARLTIQDTGPGIPPAVLRELRLRGLTTKSDGTGFGLAIARAIAERHGGRLELESAPGCGTTAIITLPAFAGGLNAG